MTVRDSVTSTADADDPDGTLRTSSSTDESVELSDFASMIVPLISNFALMTTDETIVDPAAINGWSGYKRKVYSILQMERPVTMSVTMWRFVTMCKFIFNKNRTRFAELDKSLDLALMTVHPVTDETVMDPAGRIRTSVIIESIKLNDLQLDLPSEFPETLSEKMSRTEWSIFQTIWRGLVRMGHSGHNRAFAVATLCLFITSMVTAVCGLLFPITCIAAFFLRIFAAGTTVGDEESENNWTSWINPVFYFKSFFVFGVVSLLVTVIGALIQENIREEENDKVIPILKKICLLESQDSNSTVSFHFMTKDVATEGTPGDRSGKENEQYYLECRAKVFNGEEDATVQTADSRGRREARRERERKKKTEAERGKLTETEREREKGEREGGSCNRDSVSTSTK